MKPKVIVHEAEEGGYWAEVPALPGCATQGDTIEELMVNLREPVEVWLEPAPDAEAVDAQSTMIEVDIERHEQKQA